MVPAGAYRGYILVYAGKSGEAVPWLEAALRFDRANTRATMYIGTAYYDSPLEEAGFEPSVPPDAVRADNAGYIAWRGSFEK